MTHTRFDGDHQEAKKEQLDQWLPNDSRCCPRFSQSDFSLSRSSSSLFLAASSSSPKTGEGSDSKFLNTFQELFLWLSYTGYEAITISILYYNLYMSPHLIIWISHFMCTKSRLLQLVFSDHTFILACFSISIFCSWWDSVSSSWRVGKMSTTCIATGESNKADQSGSGFPNSSLALNIPDELAHYHLWLPKNNISSPPKKALCLGIVCCIGCSRESIADGIFAHFVHHGVQHKLVGAYQLCHLCCTKKEPTKNCQEITRGSSFWNRHGIFHNPLQKGWYLRQTTA